MRQYFVSVAIWFIKLNGLYQIIQRERGREREGQIRGNIWFFPVFVFFRCLGQLIGQLASVCSSVGIYIALNMKGMARSWNIPMHVGSFEWALSGGWTLSLWSVPPLNILTSLFPPLSCFSILSHRSFWLVALIAASTVSLEQYTLEMNSLMRIRDFCIRFVFKEFHSFFFPFYKKPVDYELILRVSLHAC